MTDDEEAAYIKGALVARIDTATEILRQARGYASGTVDTLLVDALKLLVKAAAEARRP